MSEQARNFALVIAGLSFVVFVVLKQLAGPRRREADPEARQQMAEAKRRARDRSLTANARAEALREAATIALDVMRRPNLAASYARRAERMEPGMGDAVSLIALALRRAKRFQALERLLWRKLASEEPSSPTYQRALEELIALNETALRRPEVARALRRLSAS